MKKEEIDLFMNKYPEFHYNEALEEVIGELKLNHLYKNEQLIGNYKIRIKLEKWKNQGLPQVYDLSNKISQNNPHRYYDGRLCLSADVEQNIYFAEGGDFPGWYKEFVIPYFYAMEYYLKYRIYPAGDRSHNEQGILESYCDIFNIYNEENLMEVLKYIICVSYRGHNLCPCSSGKRVRNCHGAMIRKWKQDDYIRILNRDLKYILKIEED
jgi:hypothetical protein